MSFKELDNSSIVTDVETEVNKSLKIIITYADKTSKQSQFNIGDTIAVKFIENERLSTIVGTVTKINAESDDVYFVTDTSVTSQAYTKKIYPSQVRDISNVTSPTFDVNYDASGNVIVDTPPTTV